MSEPNGPVCPECGTPRASDGTPDCSCAARASEARRDARAAERAAAEDFDPVRIRPFVALDDEPGADQDADGGRVPQESGDLADTDAISAVPPSAQSAPDEAPLPDADADVIPRHRRRALLITGAGVASALLLTGAYLGGLFTYDSPSRDGAASGDVRAPVPDTSSADGTAPEGQSSGTASASPSPSGAGTPSSSTTPDDSSPTPSTSATTPTAPPSSAGATTSAAPEPSDAEGEPPVLRRGDRGPEVTELQLRLRQIGLYSEDADGEYDRRVESAVGTYQLTRVILNDESGVYGRATRTSLESETSEP
ncbi:peptidoglycan-binding protein [Streptomyces ferrugineus]|uniref:Peptidoglycan-binding protein n=1 Tax=Streptomyces ferrugineus TaxID=1413221 RepID=A0A7M2SBR8_9ACTN|nr:peptidoglycan-binding domain-containing protein [Streptomyces ferrugineus]QOV33800.1 peptidoglycan-binding protein [Streptomyces ferrugineus]